MSDPLCDSCHKERHLTLSVRFEMLCVTCMHDQCQYPLMEALEEKEILDGYKTAMQRIWDEIDKLGGKNGKS